jgi:hypothetical protein
MVTGGHGERFGMVENDIEIVNARAGHELTITEQLLYYSVVCATRPPPRTRTLPTAISGAADEVRSPGGSAGRGHGIGPAHRQRQPASAHPLGETGGGETPDSHIVIARTGTAYPAADIVVRDGPRRCAAASSPVLSRSCVLHLRPIDSAPHWYWAVAAPSGSRGWRG